MVPFQRSSAFQGEAFCEMYCAIALRDVCQHLKEASCDQVAGSRDLRAGEKPQWIFLHTHTICKTIQNLGSGSLSISFSQRKKHSLNLRLLQSVISLMHRSSF